MTTSGLELAGLLAGCGAAAVAIVTADPRTRHAALAVALIAAPALVAGDVWNEERVVSFRDDPTMVAAAALGALCAVAALAVLFRRRPAVFPILAFALLPLRVPVEIGGDTANLLIPLYVVIAAAAASSIWATFAPGASSRATSAPPPSAAAARWLRIALAVTLVLYATQAAYSEDVSRAIENVGFFLVPFAALFVLLLEVEWTRRLLGQVLAAVGAMAVLFALVAVYQHTARDLFLNDELFDSNQLHIYFRANSLFFDPNVLGRYLALAIVGLGAYLAWGADTGRLALAAVAAGIALVGLAFSFSISSLAALGAGLGVLAVLRWQWRGAIAVGGAAAVALVALVLLGGPPSSQLDRDIDSGHTDLIEGGLELAEDRPLAGWGSGSFGAAFFERIDETAETNVSHAEPITVGAEQGAIGLIVYVGLVALALAVLLSAHPGGSLPRSAVAACFVTMLVHSFGYAAFAIDPATWALLALGIAVRDPELAG